MYHFILYKPCGTTCIPQTGILQKHILQIHIPQSTYPLRGCSLMCVCVRVSVCVYMLVNALALVGECVYIYALVGQSKHLGNSHSEKTRSRNTRGANLMFMLK